MMSLSRVLRLQVPVPVFTKNRFYRRVNMLEMDRARFYYWNLFSIILTGLPIAYMATVNYRFCEESVLLSSMLGDCRLPSEMDRRLFASESVSSA